MNIAMRYISEKRDHVLLGSRPRHGLIGAAAYMGAAQACDSRMTVTLQHGMLTSISLAVKVHPHLGNAY